MSPERAPPSYTPISSGQPQSDANAPTLPDVTNTLEHIAQTYDSEFADLSNLLGEVADTVEDINSHRMNNLNSLREDIDKWITAVNAARKSASDTKSLERQRKEVERLEKEKQTLVQGIIQGNEEAGDLRNRLERVEKQMAKVRHAHDVVKEQTKSELPSLEYMKKVLQRLSDAYIPKPGTFEGFVSKPGTNDVRPFCYEESEPRIDRVNNLWKLICEE